ncbi:MAG: hypothetical protein R6V03_09745 [Kiritimatiellia bacterium]
MKHLTIVTVLLLSGCSTILIRSAELPLDGSYQSNRDKTMEWMKKHDPGDLIAERGKEKIETIFGDFIHEWKSGRLTLVLNENESIRTRTKWIKQSEDTFFSNEGGQIIKLISDDEYYVEAHAPAGVFREYFKKMQH